MNISWTCTFLSLHTVPWQELGCGPICPHLIEKLSLWIWDWNLLTWRFVIVITHLFEFIFVDVRLFFLIGEFAPHLKDILHNKISLTFSRAMFSPFQSSCQLPRASIQDSSSSHFPIAAFDTWYTASSASRGPWVLWAVELQAEMRKNSINFTDLNKQRNIVSRSDFFTHTGDTILANLLRCKRRISMGRMSEWTLIASINLSATGCSKTLWMGESCWWEKKLYFKSDLT